MTGPGDTASTKGLERRLRIVCDASALCDGRRTAGIGRYVAQLTAALLRRDDLELHTVVPSRPPRRDSWAVRWLHAQPHLAAAAVRRRPDLVHGMSSDPELAWPLRRQVVTVHDAVPWEPGRVPEGSPTARYLTFQRRRLRRCAAVITDSAAVAAEVVEILGIDERRVHAVPAGLTPGFVALPGPHDAELRRAAGVDWAGYVLWVGSLRAHDQRKALDVLLEAVAHLNAGAPLVLAGAPGPEAERVAREARRRGIPAALPGYVSDQTLAALYRGAAALAMPSLHEGFGLPVLEAMACGVPVVAARAGNLPDLTGDAAVLVPKGDAYALANALDAVLGDPGIRRRLSEAGPPVAAGYTWERTAALTVAVYRQALSDFRRGAG
jgi:glycosyltransferase involved in cell wall biosynthesis